MQDIRQFPRKQIIARGEILTDDGVPCYTGSLFNVSEGGAMISIVYGFQFPTTFRFRIAGQLATRPAAVAWQSSGLAGIVFLS